MISEKIARRVAQAAELLRYQANPIAYSLRTRRSQIAGVLVPDLTNPVFPPIIRGIEDALAAAGYTAIVANTDNDADRERLAVHNLVARHVDGLILATARRRDPLVEHCLREEIPLVLVNRTVETGGVSSVVTDDAFGMQLVIEHLAQLGHARIAHVGGPKAMSTGFARHRGFLKGMRTARLPAAPRLIVSCAAFNESEGRRAFLQLRARDRSFTAVAAGNDLLALGCYDALRELGLRVAQDVSVSGFNDMPFVDKLKPPLTTVRIPLYQMGAQAARTLLARLDEPGAPVEQIMLRPQLVVRGSTGPPRRIRRPARHASPATRGSP